MKPIECKLNLSLPKAVDIAAKYIEREKGVSVLKYDQVKGELAITDCRESEWHKPCKIKVS